MTTMTRVHFNLIANVMKDTKPKREDMASEVEFLAALYQWNSCVFELSAKFRGTNPGFKPEFFLKACGV